VAWKATALDCWNEKNENGEGKRAVRLIQAPTSIIQMHAVPSLQILGQTNWAREPICSMSLVTQLGFFDAVITQIDLPVDF